MLVNYSELMSCILYFFKLLKVFMHVLKVEDSHILTKWTQQKLNFITQFSLQYFIQF